LARKARLRAIGRGLASDLTGLAIEKVRLNARSCTARASRQLWHPQAGKVQRMAALR
jgi:hypothetical protein